MDSRISRSLAKSLSGIQWCDFSAGGAWAGCTPISARPGALSGCSICYAEGFCSTRMGMKWGKDEPRRRLNGFAARMKRIDRAAAASGNAYSVFAGSLSDWLDGEVDPAWRSDLIDVVESCPSLTWLFLTHRPGSAKSLLPASWRTSPPANLWAGTTVDHPAHADRWTVHHEFWGHTGRDWISAEPLAGSLSGLALQEAACIVIGGASNTKDPAWALDPKWVDEAVAEFGEDRIFFKQYGVFVDGKYVGDKAAGGRAVGGKVFDRTPWPRHRAELEARAGETAP